MSIGSSLQSAGMSALQDVVDSFLGGAPAMLAGAAGAPTGFAKASLKIEGGRTLECYFNPTEYSVTKTNEWTHKPVTGNSYTKPEFGGGQPRQLELSLLFDQTFPPFTMPVRESTGALLDWYQKTVVQAQPVTLQVTLLDSASASVRVWSFANAYPVKWTSGDLTSGSTEIVTEQLEVAHTGMTVQAVGK